MSVVGDALRPFWMSGINSISGELSTSFKAWLTEGEYVYQGLNANKELVFVPIDFDVLLKSVAYDINRMSMAAVESVHGIQNPNDLTRSTAWGLIRSYYSAFYACHAICRIFSVLIPKIDSPQSSKLNKIINSSGWLGDAIYVTDDLYKVTIDSINKTFILSKLATKGHHEGAWKEFGLLLSGLETRILSNVSIGTIADRQDASMLLNQLRNILQSDRCTQSYNWLSQIRNNLNYRHEYGAWYPHEKSSKFRSSFHTNSACWKKDPSEIASHQEDHPILKFSKGCTLILSILHTLIIEMEKRNSDENSFLKYGVYRLI